MGLSYSSDLIHWTEATETPALPKRPGKLDSRVVEPGPPPVLMTDGIVLVYNGADDKLVCRSEAPLFAPELEWEKVGQLPNVVFVEGLVADKDRYLLYYGGADNYVGVAAADTLYAK